MDELLHQVVFCISRICRTTARDRHSASRPAVCLTRYCGRKHDLMVLAVVGRSLTRCRVGEVHFHGPALGVHLITCGKSQVQTMLGEVNAGYHLAGGFVPNRESATQNWRSGAFAAMGQAKWSKIFLIQISNWGLIYRANESWLRCRAALIRLWLQHWLPAPVPKLLA